MAQEGHLASNALLSGFEAINRMNYDKPGTVYSALFQLAAGFERIMKIAVILNHKTLHDLEHPKDAEMRAFGHSIDKLYTHCKEIALGRDFKTGWFDEGALQGEVLAFLSRFAKGSRYYNLDQSASGTKNTDPLIQWFVIHFEIAEFHLTCKRRNAVMTRAQKHCDQFSLLGWEMGPMGRYDLTVDVTYQLEIARLSKGYCVWTLIEILKPIYQLVDYLSAEVHDIEKGKQVAQPSVPYMEEFFPFCLATKTNSVRRKNWTSLFHIAGRV